MNLLQIHEPGSTPDPHAQETELAIGIDLGTTNTVAAIATRQGPEVLRAAEAARCCPPSCITAPMAGRGRHGGAGRCIR